MAIKKEVFGVAMTARMCLTISPEQMSGNHG